MRQVLIATNNEGKAAEFREMLQDRAEVLTLKDVPAAPEAEETGATFQENAAIKAEAAAQALNMPVIADDSGLEVDALDGAPGVYSARFAGPQKDDRANNDLLLEKLQGLPQKERTARFVCVLAVARPEKETLTVKGTIEGVIAMEPQGTNGFGYDPLMYLPELGCTMAELSSVEKNAQSHRHEALKQLLHVWNEIFQEGE
ncbi:XTP/dITP diphosphohydrolase [Salsuginibacillus halophilus]|uniref:dITP/XTP pyrophosphatase n=1 Tax=Salsuginibacillus halophilus TaxID=517424 RepID=A0A2P8HCQ8_9BACI|nr:XTP/dITP diphosphatase [Salsuginibacillus halophilus]PSL44017.1 XTP/dITP diphosphohydrolase [Salsuginibacillus halophilus]